jgi:hypothetical protein
MTYAAIRSLFGWDHVLPRELRATTIRPIPVGSAHVIVTIDGRPYAGFINRTHAETAVLLWMGEVNGCGHEVPAEQRAESGWLAVRGHTLGIVER